MKSLYLTSLKEPLDFDLQIVACELDASATRLKYYSSSSSSDALDIDKFNKLFNHIKEQENFITSINDNTELYELSESSNTVVLYEDLNDKFIIFDKEDGKEINHLIDE